MMLICGFESVLHLETIKNAVENGPNVSKEARFKDRIIDPKTNVTILIFPGILCIKVEKLKKSFKKF